MEELDEMTRDKSDMGGHNDPKGKDGGLGVRRTKTERSTGKKRQSQQG